MENSPTEGERSRSGSKGNSTLAFRVPGSSGGNEVVNINAGHVPARFRRTNSLAEMFQDEAAAAVARLSRPSSSSSAGWQCTGAHVEDVDELPGLISDSHVQSKLIEVSAPSGVSQAADQLINVDDIPGSTVAPPAASVQEPSASSLQAPADTRSPPPSNARAPQRQGGVAVDIDFGSSAREPQRQGGVAIDIDFGPPAKGPPKGMPASLHARLSRAPASKLLAAQTAAPRRGTGVTAQQRRPSSLDAHRKRTRPAPVREGSSANCSTKEQQSRRVAPASEFLNSESPLEFLAECDALDLDVKCTPTDTRLVSSHPSTTGIVKALCSNLRNIDAEGVSKLLEWRFTVGYQLAHGVLPAKEVVAMLCEEAVSQKAAKSSEEKPKNLTDQVKGVASAMEAATIEKAGEEDHEVLERLKNEIEQLSLALREPELSAAESYTLRKQLATRRSEKARAERAVRKGRKAQVEISGGYEAVAAIMASLPTAARGADARQLHQRDRPLSMNGLVADDGPFKAYHERSPQGVDGRSALAPRPPGFDESKEAPADGSAALMLAVLLHPDTLSAAGSAAVGRVGMLAKEFKLIALDGGDASFGDTAWRCACQALARERALWCPSPIMGVEKKGFWQTLLVEQLWPARRKWEATEGEGPRRLGQMGIRPPKEGAAQDFKIQVSARFKPGEVTQGRLLVPLHQKLMMLRKAGADVADKIGQKEPPEFLDALMGHVMVDPVLLPSSGKVCDRRVIQEQLRHRGGRDPFDGTPLTADMLVPQTELCARLLEWRAAARQRAVEGGDEHKLEEKEMKELIGELGGELDPEVVEMVMEADRLRAAGKRALREAQGPRQKKTREDEEEAEEDRPDAEEGHQAWWEEDANNLGAAAAAAMPVAGQRVHDGRGMADAGEEEIGEAPSREGPRLLAVTPPTRLAMFQPGSGVRPFVFAHVFDGNASQEEVYEHTARSSVCAVLNGFNACLLCYGQTGSGKTHTMFGQSVACGGNAGAVVSKQSGCVMRALRELLQAGAELEETCGVSLTFSAQYVQIYQDQVSCLSSGNAVMLREAVAGAPVLLQGAADKELQGLGDASQLLAAGEERKRYAETAMNHRSSRAHTVLAIKVTQRRGDLEVVSQLHLVDLAGSERVKKSRVQGGRLVEAVGINSSLMVLGRCIAARVEDRSHVPYYESRLTLLLRSALGGNSRTNVIICCHKEERHGDETLQALSFGERCAMISNRAQAAMASSASAALASIDAALTDCSRQIEGLEARGKGHLPACGKLREKHSTLSRRRRELADRIKEQEAKEAAAKEAGEAGP